MADNKFRLRTLHILLNLLQENPKSNKELAKMWGIHLTTIWRDTEAIKNNLPEFEAAVPNVVKALHLAAKFYAVLEEGGSVEVTFDEENNDTIPTVVGG